MTFRLTRAQAYEVAWAKPIRDIAKLVGVSDVGLAKSLREGGIPLPPVGYWNKVAAGKPTKQTALPLADLSVPLDVWVAGDLGAARALFSGEPGYDDADEPIATLVERFRARIGKITVPSSSAPHRDVVKLVDRIDRQIARWSDSSLRDHFLPSLERRKDPRLLRLVNAMLAAAEHFGQGGYLRSSSSEVLEVHLHFAGMGTTCTVAYEGTGGGSLTIRAESTRGDHRWQDGKEGRLEQQLTEIIVQLAQDCAEVRRRMNSNIRTANKKAEEAAERERIRAAAKAIVDTERLRRQEAKQRVRDLLKAARDSQRAAAIRAFVLGISGQQLGLDQWATWALEQADALDPVKNGSLKASVERWRPDD